MIRAAQQSPASRIPTELAKPGSLYDPNWSTLPLFQKMAAFDAGHYVPFSSWRKLSEAEQQYVLASWAANGIAAVEASNQLALVQQGQESSAPEVYLMNREQFEFMTTDARIRFNEAVSLTVRGAGTVKEARRMIAAFLKDAETFGLRLE